MSLTEAVPFYEEKLGFERLGSPLYFGINEKSEVSKELGAEKRTDADDCLFSQARTNVATIVIRPFPIRLCVI